MQFDTNQRKMMTNGRSIKGIMVAVVAISVSTTKKGKGEGGKDNPFVIILVNSM